MKNISLRGVQRPHTSPRPHAVRWCRQCDRSFSARQGARYCGQPCKQRAYRIRNGAKPRDQVQDPEHRPSTTGVRKAPIGKNRTSRVGADITDRRTDGGKTSSRARTDGSSNRRSIAVLRLVLGPFKPSGGKTGPNPYGSTPAERHAVRVIVALRRRNPPAPWPVVRGMLAGLGLKPRGAKWHLTTMKRILRRWRWSPELPTLSATPAGGPSRVTLAGRPAGAPKPLKAIAFRYLSELGE